MTRDDVISMAREAGIEFALAPMAMVTQSELQRFAELVAAKETEARQAAQLETIALREELTKRAMHAEKEAYQRGVRDEREMCAKIAESTVCDTHIPTGVKIYGRRAAQEIRNRKEEE